MFKDKQKLKRSVGSYAFAERFKYRVSRSSNTRFTAECRQGSCGWVLRVWKSNRETYWHVNSFVNEHTCDRNDNYNIEFKRVRAHVIWDLFASKFSDPGHNFCSKDIVSEMREQYAIHLSYNKTYRSVICIDATHLKARTRGVLLVAVCKDINEMINPLAFGFANSECIKSWTWFLKKLCKLIQYPVCVMLVSDRHNDIFNAMEAIFPDASYGICAYHLAQNLKIFYKQRDDVISLYYRATYAYCIDDFNRIMDELKETYRKVYNELLGIGINKFSRVHSLRKRFKGMSINAFASELYITGFLKHAYEMDVNLVPDPKFRDIPDAIRNSIVLQWKKKNLSERLKKLRIPSVGEKRKVQSCSKCGQKRMQ
ncbi:hypothetical protein Ddye_030709 [Dipteronia dyeriana]|uniref:MULE transposase domain-containing protein n=1 Tax=Dipteronia dyeriana TaxID=168575 RepID=A0AAD9TGZ1_9ROSI|nr:hypothetical protein Ddye_030709 [Dipteronia dyeriana]